MVESSGVSSHPGVRIKQVELYRKYYPKTKGNGDLVRVSGSSSYLGCGYLGCTVNN